MTEIIMHLVLAKYVVSSNETVASRSVAFSRTLLNRKILFARSKRKTWPTISRVSATLFAPRWYNRGVYIRVCSGETMNISQIIVKRAIQSSITGEI